MLLTFGRRNLIAATWFALLVLILALGAPGGAQKNGELGGGKCRHTPCGSSKCDNESGLREVFSAACTLWVAADSQEYADRLKAVMDNMSGQHEADRARCGYTLLKFHCPKKPLNCEQKNRVIIDMAPYETSIRACPFHEPLEPPRVPGDFRGYEAWKDEHEAWFKKCWKWSKEKEDDILKHPEKYNTDPRCNGSSKPSS
jgi:hypothetical protein